MMKTKQFLWLVTLTLVLTACFGPNTQELAATSVAQTQAAASPTISPTITPVPPTRTPRPTRTQYATRTPIPSATKTLPPDMTATVQALLTQSVQLQEAEVKAALEKVGLADVSGSLGWSSPLPIEIPATAYNSLVSQYLDTGEFGDFALQTDVTWNTSTGYAGCGLVFHAEDQEALGAGAQYRFITLRLSGAPTWTVEFWQFGKRQFILLDEPQTNPAIKIEQGSANRYLLVKRNRQMTLYANDTRLGVVDITERPQGFVYFFAVQESGRTTCVFNNTWIWKFDQ